MQSNVTKEEVLENIFDATEAINEQNRLVKELMKIRKDAAPMNYKREDVPKPYLKIVDAIYGLIDKTFKHCDFQVIDWVDKMMKLNDDTWKMELKSIYRVHVKKGDYLILSVFYDENEIASVIMSTPYYEIYPVPKETILRFYPTEFNEMMAMIKTVIKANYKEYNDKYKVIELKNYFDRRSLDRRIRGRR